MAQVANGLWMSQIARNLTDAEAGIWLANSTSFTTEIPRSRLSSCA